MEPAEAIPDVANLLEKFVRRRSVRRGQCLDHLSRFMNMPEQLRDLSRACMGPIQGGAFLHCWIEAGEYVVDLTGPHYGLGKVFGRAHYYRVAKVDSKRVKRLEYAEVCERLTKTNDFRFWESEGQEGPMPDLHPGQRVNMALRRSPVLLLLMRG